MFGRKGFSLVELLVVVAIISMLAAIAIPQYSEFKRSAYNATAQYSIKSLVNAQEAYHADTLLYAACDGADNCQSSLVGFKKTENVEIESDLVGDGYSLHSCSSKGTKHYVYDSSDSPGKFALSSGITTNLVGTIDNAPADATIGDDCTL